ncbi:MAG: N-succinylarginine dihydrolase [Pirellulaceae bacterium]|nr:N-succinylarginine dihydrolase [Pirellulaceae bacterium]
MYVELNIDALVGPTHHFGGVGVGNIASAEHRRQVSSPRRAALEGLDKAMLVASLGVPQFIFPPLARPLPDLLTRLGFVGDFQTQCRAARLAASQALSATFSSAFMWAANAATFAPACDTLDGRHHLTLASLSSSWHRLPEHLGRQSQIEDMLSGLPSDTWCVHPALPCLVPLRDEGAANHMRLSNSTGSHRRQTVDSAVQPGWHVFVYGATEGVELPKRFMARQTLEACQAIARLHHLDPSRTFFLQQHPDAIDAGVFHNDVIATSHRHVMIYHAQAFLNAEAELSRLAQSFAAQGGQPLQLIRVEAHEMSLSDAVQSYLFNSQLVTPATDPDSIVLICAAQCQQLADVRQLIERWIADPKNPIQAVHYVSLEESMSGGGGPACLRLRLQLPTSQLDSFAPGYRLTSSLADRLREVIERFYPTRLQWETLAEQENLQQIQSAYKALSTLTASGKSES